MKQKREKANLREKNLLLIANYYPPLSGPGVYRPYFFVKYIHKYFNSITVLTSKSDVVYGEDSSLDYNFDNVNVIRLPGSNYSNFQRLLFKLHLHPLFNFLFPTLFWERQVPWARKAKKWILQNAKEKDFNLIYATTGPFVSGILAKKISHKLDVPYVLDMRDPFSLSPARIWMSYLHWKLFQKIELKVILESKQTIMVSPGMKEHYLRSFPKLQEEKMSVILNGFDGKIEKDLPKQKQDILKITYAGTLKDYDGRSIQYSTSKLNIPYRRVNYNVKTRSLYYFIEGIKLLPTELAKKLRVYIHTNSKLSYTKGLIEKYDLQKQFIFIEKIPYTQVHQKLVNSDILLLPMEERIDGGKSYFMTGKLYEFVKSNRPILALGSTNDITELLEEVNYSFFHAENDPDSVKNAILKIMDQKENTGNNFIGMKEANDNLLALQRKYQAQQLLKILND